MIQHRSPISGIAAYADQYIASAGYDNQVILWDQGTQRPVNRVLHDHLANQCAFSPDGSLLVTSSSDYTARLWSVPELRLLAVLNDQADDVEMSAFHPSRELIATASRDHRLRVYDFGGNLVHSCAGHTADVISVDWSADGSELVTSSDDGTVKRWSSSTGELLEDIDLGGVETDTIVIDGDGTIYAGNDEGQIIVIRGESRTTVQGHDAGIKRLVLGAGRDLLVSLSYDRKLLLWQTSGGELRRVGESGIPDDVWPRSCAFAAGTTLVFGTFGASYRSFDYTTGTWSTAEVAPTPGVNAVVAHAGSVHTVGDAGIVHRDGAEQARMGSLCNFLTPVGEGLTVTGGQLGKVMDAATGRVLHQHRSPLNCGVRFEVDGVAHVLIGAYTGEGLVFRIDADGEPRHVTDVALHENAVKGVAASGDLLFSVCADTGVAWHDARTLKLVHRIEGAHDRIANGCVGLSGGHFASVGRDLKLRIWSPDFSAEVIPTTHPNSIKCIAADTSGRLIATGSYHGHVKVYDRESKTWTVEDRPTTSGISSLAYDEDRGLFLAGSYDSAVYEIPGESA
ncbi:WD40 repeat domain-containing protein [Streptomyces roseirectus]|uniref:WD40 repeat domain-containing protein n=1 Tax=Streptomyces roseirectus TaxID=2768066 RepID=A0A7H0IN67_9ACTN|nr:WD40 repeat domain-containing protein [Streptomyces roseirectus]QNP74233.1 WD40 repeat domain-containing protein [Streptomyces roseirectus]